MNTPHVDVKGIVKVKVKGIVKVDIKRNPLMWSRRQDIKNFLLMSKEAAAAPLSGQMLICVNYKQYKSISGIISINASNQCWNGPKAEIDSGPICWISDL